MRKRSVFTLVVAALVFGVAVGSIGLAVGATSSSGTNSSAAAPQPRGGGGPGGPGGMGRGGHGGPGGGDLVRVVSKLTGETTTTLFASMRSGSSLASIAASKSVTVDQIVALASNAPKAALVSEVSDGLATQAEADAWLAQFKTVMTAQLNAKPGSGPAGFGGGRGRGADASTTPPAGGPGGFAGML